MRVETSLKIKLLENSGPEGFCQMISRAYTSRRLRAGTNQDCNVCVVFTSITGLRSQTMD